MKTAIHTRLGGLLLTLSLCSAPLADPAPQDPTHPALALLHLLQVTQMSAQAGEFKSTQGNNLPLRASVRQQLLKNIQLTD